MTKIEKIEEAYTTFVKSADTTITTWQLKNYLDKYYGEEVWTSSYVSMFLQNKDLVYEVSTDRTRVYKLPVILTKDSIQNVAYDLVKNRQPITKRSLRVGLGKAGLPLDEFEKVFKECNFVHSGEYTGDNKKIWVPVESGKHFSKSKKAVVDIKTMPKKYLMNTIAKYVMGNGQAHINEILRSPTSEIYKLLYAFFTYDIRNNI